MNFRDAIMRVASVERDAWLDEFLGIDEVPNDGPELPRGCVPYLPCPVDALVRVFELAHVNSSDVFVDIGSGIGRAAVLAHLMTGATTIGLEIQPALVRASRTLLQRLDLPRVSIVEGDASRLPELVASGTVFFLYCPFSGERLLDFLKTLELVARIRPIRVCSVGLPIPSVSWLSSIASVADIEVFESKQVRATAGS